MRFKKVVPTRILVTHKYTELCDIIATRVL
jgi:hypothetical protein